MTSKVALFSKSSASLTNTNCLSPHNNPHYWEYHILTGARNSLHENENNLRFLSIAQKTDTLSSGSKNSDVIATPTRNCEENPTSCVPAKQLSIDSREIVDGVSLF